MGKHGSNKKINSQQKQSKSESKKLTVEDVKNSASIQEFESKKEELFKLMYNEIEQLEKYVSEAKAKAQTAQNELEAIQKKKDELSTARDDLSKQLTTAKKELEDARKQKDEAETEAKKVLDDAEEQKFKKISEAAEEARGAWEAQVNELKTQLDKIAEKDHSLFVREQQLLEKERQFDEDKEELDALKEFVNKQKEKYLAASPDKINELELTVTEERNKYNLLSEKYKEQTQKYHEAQILLDSIKLEVDDLRGAESSSSVGSLLKSFNEIKQNYSALLSLHSRYPDEESIIPIEKKARDYDTLQEQYEILERDRDRLEEEFRAKQQTQRELEVVRREVEATNALNEHLLEELESHKTALENRTGDTCPSLTNVDEEVESKEFKEDIRKRFGRGSINTLKELVCHVKNYAGSRAEEEKLYYTDNDIRAFVAGMAVSRLIILQGMSGTGKSSLPRIFSQAISGFNHLIPVESSWRDRNELLGYYNDFNKKFNAKVFTIELYRSGKQRCVDIPTFIVLDEMNLARIEYYFSDFLAILQEPDQNKWLIDLVSSDMRTLPMAIPDELKEKLRVNEHELYSIWDRIERSRNGELKNSVTEEEKAEISKYLAKLNLLVGAKDLIDGRKVKVTKNIWFIGTANRDESTFEISDKVYDRAQTVSLDKKGEPEGRYESVSEKYVLVDKLIELFENAKNNVKIKNSVKDKLDKLDSLLMEKFDVSFGNRTEKQICEFVAVFCDAGGKEVDALDYQISTKILRKIITSDDQEALIDLQAATKEYEKTQRLIAKRLKDLNR